MCEIITATLDRKTSINHVLPFFERLGFTIRPVEGVAAKNLKDELYFRPLNTSCDCGTVLGVAHRSLTPEEATRRHELEIQRFRKEGWSQTKIKRWEDQKSAQSPISSRKAQAKPWMELIKALLTESRVPHVGLMVYSYGGTIVEANLPVGKPKRILYCTLTEDLLYGMENGILYRFMDSAY